MYVAGATVARRPDQPTRARTVPKGARIASAGIAEDSRYIAHCSMSDCEWCVLPGVSHAEEVRQIERLADITEELASMSGTDVSGYTSGAQTASNQLADALQSMLESSLDTWQLPDEGTLIPEDTWQQIPLARSHTQFPPEETEGASPETAQGSASCTRCGVRFLRDGSDGQCVFHPGRFIRGGRMKWLCCGAKKIDATGCQVPGCE